jgi:hypothetical protein
MQPLIANMGRSVGGEIWWTESCEGRWMRPLFFPWPQPPSHQDITWENQLPEDQWVRMLGEIPVGQTSRYVEGLPLQPQTSRGHQLDTWRWTSESIPS